MDKPAWLIPLLIWVIQNGNIILLTKGYPLFKLMDYNPILFLSIYRIMVVKKTNGLTGLLDLQPSAHPPRSYQRSQSSPPAQSSMTSMGETRGTFRYVEEARMFRVTQISTYISIYIFIFIFIVISMLFVKVNYPNNLQQVCQLENSWAFVFLPAKIIILVRPYLASQSNREKSTVEVTVVMLIIKKNHNDKNGARHENSEAKT